MVEEILRYDRMVETALRDVVRQALGEVALSGLPGDHHFYVTFTTAFPGVKIPRQLAEQYPDEMTIVIQHQFYDLDITDDILGVTLSFNNVPERLTVPLAAVTTFADPSVNFALQFQPMAETEERREEAVATISKVPAPTDTAEPEMASPDAGEKVVTLDQFRKK